MSRVLLRNPAKINQSDELLRLRIEGPEGLGQRFHVHFATGFVRWLFPESSLRGESLCFPLPQEVVQGNAETPSIDRRLPAKAGEISENEKVNLLKRILGISISRTEPTAQVPHPLPRPVV